MKRTVYYLASLLFLFALTMPSGCVSDTIIIPPEENAQEEPGKPEEPDVPDVPTDYKLGENVTNIAQQDFDGYVAKPVEDSVLYLSASTPAALIPAKGEILLCPEISDKFPNGFLGKVAEVVQENGSIKVITVPAALEEAFEELTVSETIDLTDKITKIYSPDGKEIPFSIEDELTKASSNGALKLTFNEINYKDFAKLSGSLSFSYKLTVEANIRNHTLEYFHILFESKVTPEAKLDIKGTKKETIPFEIANIPLPPITIGPLVITDEIHLDLCLLLEASIGASFGISTPITSKFGYTYDGRDAKGSFEYDPLNPEFKFNTEFFIKGKVGVGPNPKLVLKFFNLEQLQGRVGVQAIAALSGEISYIHLKPPLRSCTRFSIIQRLRCRSSSQPTARLASNY